MAIVKVHGTQKDGLFTPLKRPRVDDFKNSPKRCRPYRACRGRTSHRKGSSLDSKEDLNTKSYIHQGLRKQQSSSDQERPSRMAKTMAATFDSKNSHFVLGRNSRSFLEYHQPYQASVPVSVTSQKSKEVEHNVRKKVMEAVEAYEEQLTKCKAKNSKGASTRAAMELRKQGKWVNNMNQVGSVRGVKVGDKFRHRAQLTIIGLHRQLTSGIDSMRRNDGKLLATSIVDSRRGYVNNLQSSDLLIYSGEGGKSLFETKPKSQMKGGNLIMQGGNLALKNSQEEGTPIRFIRKHPKGSFYVYYGLYTVERVLQDRESSGMIYKFRLRRRPEQPDILFDNS